MAEAGVAEIGATIAAIQRHAREAPDRHALVDEGHVVSYAVLWRDICLVLATLQRLSLAPDSIAAVEWDRPYRHLLLLLALEHLGVASASYVVEQAAVEFRPLIAAAAITFSVSRHPEGAGRVQIVDDAWWHRVLTAPRSLHPVRPVAAEYHRIACSSGTTGHPKFMMRSRVQSEFRFDQSQQRLDFQQNSRLVLPASFAFQANYILAIACLRAGGLAMFSGEERLDAVLRQVKATHTVVVPMELGNLRASILQHGLPEGLKGLVVGGRITEEDRHTWHQACPTGSLIEVYGTNETGTIAVMTSGGLGKIIAGLDVQIVDDDDELVPPGMSGHIRVRGVPCATGYLFQEDAATDRFRDGWFYPGDLGMREGTDSLRLLGRNDDLLNIRGIKILATEVEASLCTLPGIEDCCVISIPDASDDGVIWVGLHYSEGADFQGLEAQIKAKLMRGGVFRIFSLNPIPRSPSGKIRRHLVMDLLRQHMSGQPRGNAVRD